MPRRRDEYDPENVEDEDQVDAIDEDDNDYGPSRGGFIVNERDDHDAEDARRMHRPPLLTREDEQEDTEVEQQALLPSVRDPKLWMVKCAKCIDKAAGMQIRTAIALDHLKNYIYIEADKEAHVREACKGMRYIFTGSKILLVPIKEMTDVLSVESKAIDISRDTWVRMKIGTYKGDLAKVVDVDNVRHRVTVKLIPRIDLQALANKLEGREVQKKKAFTPPPRFMNVDGRQGSVEHIYRGILVIYDRHHMEHAGFICTKSQSCILVGGSRANGDRNGNPLASTVAQLRTPSRFPNFPGRSPARGVPPPSGGRHIGGGRGRDSLAGTSVKIRLGPWKGYKGRVVDASGTTVRIELESQMKVVTVDRTHVSDIVNATTTTPYRDTHRYGSGSETPMHPSRTPLHPYMTPMRDSGGWFF
ncbi:KOW-like protein [Artemisia annua]|uniref:KOW-like protein n=1 Tax=Artemisia annua TaxID=35608 RepID=A0A2U1NSN7_ARTAN|nr:KOW-like protein [Artemisia annua]